MKITISTLGSRGDVQPYLALAVGLQAAGHHVTLAAPKIFAGWIQSYGVTAVPVRFNPQVAMQELGKSMGGLRTLGAMMKILRNGMEESQDDVWEAAQDTEFFIQSGTGMGALEFASLRGIPSAFAHLYPFAPSREFPMFWLPFRFSLGGGYNLLTHKIMARVLWRFGGSLNNEWRSRLNLPPIRSQDAYFTEARKLNTPYLLGYSPSFLPKPSDWDHHQHITGYWFLEEPPGWEPPEDLVEFLKNGPPPVFIGFGSMSNKNPERVARTALQALKETGQRGVLQTGWGGISQEQQTENVFFVDDIPHRWLFPKMAAIVHHGGAGTTGTALRAGVVQIIVPFGGDQVSWADLVGKAGVGLKIKGMRKLTPSNLANAIHTALTNNDMRECAAALGEKIRAEKGIAHAIEIIERHAN